MKTIVVVCYGLGSMIGAEELHHRPPAYAQEVYTEASASLADANTWLYNCHEEPRSVALSD